MARLSAVGDAITNYSAHVVKDELELVRPCNPTSYDLGFALRRREKGAAGHPDANQELAFLEANRRPLDKLYDEYKAAKRTEPQVIFRPGIRQVLGVR